MERQRGSREKGEKKKKHTRSRDYFIKGRQGSINRRVLKGNDQQWVPDSRRRIKLMDRFGRDVLRKINSTAIQD